MIRNVFFEIKKAVLSVRMLWSIIIGIMLLYQPEFYLHKMQASLWSFDLSNAMQASLGLGAFVMLSTALCAIPFADRYCWEKRTRFCLYAQYRQGRINYAFSKICATAISGGISVMLPFALFCLLHILIVPSSFTNLDPIHIALQESFYFFIYGSAWAVLALGFSSFTNSPLVVLAVPLCIERGVQLVAVAFKADWLRLSDAIAVQCGSVYSHQQIITVNSLLLAIGIALFARGMVKEHAQL